MFLLVILVAGVWLWNFATLQQPIGRKLNQDPRNTGVVVNVHYENFVNPATIVFDLQRISLTNSAADVSRVLLQSSSALKQKTFDSVILAFRGRAKFVLKGEYFLKLGEEYGAQNPIYTLRTLPENVLKLDGTPAFTTWTGGLFGVVGKQVDELNEFHQQWWLSEALQGAN